MAQLDLEAQYLGGAPLAWQQDIEILNSPQLPGLRDEGITLDLDELELQEISNKGKVRSADGSTNTEEHPPQYSRPHNKLLARILGKRSPRQKFRTKDLPFLGPEDPPTWPLHKTLFLVGHFFPPCWFVGTFLGAPDEFTGLFRWRCQAMAMISFIIIIALIILEVGL